jgi:hypothetical protein
MTVRYESLTAHPKEVLQDICEFLALEFEPSMLEFYRNHLNVEPEIPDGRHHRLLAGPATTERIGRSRKAFSQSQIALVETCLGDEMRQLGYSTQTTSSVKFTAQETAALAEGLKLYEQMRTGVLRNRLRRRGKIKLDAYRWLGSPLAVIPWRRLAVTSKDWQARALQSMRGDEN